MNNSSHNGIECRSADSSAAVERCDLYIDERDNFDTVRELNDTTTDEISKLPNGLRSVKCKSNSPESYVESSDSMTPDCKFNVSGTAIFPVKVIRADHKETELSLGNQIDMQGIQVELNKEVYERKQFNHDTSNFLNSHSPTKDSHDEKQHEKTVDSGTLSFVAEVLKPPKSSENHGEARKLNERSQVPDVRVGAVLAEEVIQCIKTDLDDKSCTQHQQTAIPCLVSEMSGSHYRKLLANPAACSAISNSATSPKTSKAKCLVANKTSISLDLNDLASAGRGEIVVRRQKLACRRHTISSPRTMSSLNPEMKSLHPPLATVAKERVFEVQKVDAQLNKNACENSTIGEGMWFPQSSRKMKRKIPHTVEETDSCKRCSCKRSKCLKLYCACFAAGIHCVEPCNCQDCFNKPAHEDIVHESRRQIESRKPLAFAPKVIMSSGTPNCGNELNQTPASATYKCSCKKSRCVKKYCECFQGGVGCSPSCRCESCQNSFGQQGIEVIVFEKAKMLKESALEAPKKDNENQAAHEHFNNRY